MNPVRNMKNLIIFLFIFLILLTPALSFAEEGWKGLIPCSNTATTDTATTVTPAGDCDFNALMKLINTIIHFILFNLVVPIAAVMFAYAGFLMVTSGGNTEARGKAKGIFTNAALGLVIAAAAWLIIRTILSILGYKYIGTFF